MRHLISCHHNPQRWMVSIDLFIYLYCLYNNYKFAHSYQVHGSLERYLISKQLHCGKSPSHFTVYMRMQ